MYLGAMLSTKIDMVTIVYLVLFLGCVLMVLSPAVTDRYNPEGVARVQPRVSRSTSSDPAELTALYWTNSGQAAIDQRLRRLQNRNIARNLIMFLGDGLSMPTITAARILHGQRNNRPGEETVLSYEIFPTVGLVKTYCLNRQVADSACATTALFCGVKSNFATLGVTGVLARFDGEGSRNASVHVESIAEWALGAGWDVGLVTTMRITDATPAAAYAKSANRDWESDGDIISQGHDPLRCPDIAHQLVHHYPGNQFKVILGGGRREFLPNTFSDEEGSFGRRGDGRNLIEEWIEDKRSRNVSYQYVWNRQQLLALGAAPPEYLLGLFDSSHMEYHMLANPSTEPTLAELTEIAIRSLSCNEKGYFLFVEGGRINTAHHDNYVQLALDETLQLAEAVDQATGLVSEGDTLVVVTSDHSHVLAMNGYKGCGADILDTSDYVDELGTPYMVLSYINGPGFRPHEPACHADVTSEINFTMHYFYH